MDFDCWFRVVSAIPSTRETLYNHLQTIHVNNVNMKTKDHNFHCDSRKLIFIWCAHSALVHLQAIQMQCIRN